ncbi:hypothetical protein N2152v2_001874 [Parachlorella kessleri]
MARGPKKHLKRLNAPKHWMLDKLGGIFAPKPSAGPHKTRECLPLILLLRNRLNVPSGEPTAVGYEADWLLLITSGHPSGGLYLAAAAAAVDPWAACAAAEQQHGTQRTLATIARERACFLSLACGKSYELGGAVAALASGRYALTGKEVTSILMQRLVEVDRKVRTDKTYPVGFMDVVTIPKTDEHFRLVYDCKGRFVVHRISKEEAAYKLCKVRRVQFGKGGVPYIATHDGRTIRYPDPDIKVNDTVMLDLETGKIKDFVKFDVGNLCMVTGGHNNGRVGTVVHKEKHKGSFDIVHVKDAVGHTFATRMTNVFVIGKGDKPLVSLPKGKGIRQTILQEQAKQYGKTATA